MKLQRYHFLIVFLCIQNSFIITQKRFDTIDYPERYVYSDKQKNYVNDFSEIYNLTHSLPYDETTLRSHLRLLTIDERIRVIGKAVFKSNVVMDKKLRVHGRARFYKNVHFKKNVRIDGTLSVNDIVIIGCIGDLCVDNLSVVDETISGTLSVNDIVIASCIDNLCVDSLSVVDETVTGTLSVNDIVILSCIDDLCVASLSVADEAFIAALSVVDETVTGTLSAAEEVIGCDLTVGCNINMNNSTSASVGNINKNGSRFLHNFGTNDTFVGTNAGNFTTTGSNNVGLGFSTLTVVTTGIDNTAVGSVALASNTAGNGNTAVGRSALNANTTGTNNVAIGVNSLVSNVTGVENTAVGSNTLQANTTDFNTAVGFNALNANTTGDENTAVGHNSLSANTTGVRNTVVGKDALHLNVNGSDNTVIGAFAGNQLISGANNVFIGSGAGLNIFGSDNIAISNIGTNVDTGIIRIGTFPFQNQCFIQGIVNSAVSGFVVFVDASGQLGLLASSRKFKHSIEPIANESCSIFDLNPVTFIYNSDETQTKQFGLIAEEVDQIFPSLVIKKKDGSPYSVRYEVLPILLLNEMKKLVARVEILEKHAYATE